MMMMMMLFNLSLKVANIAHSRISCLENSRKQIKVTAKDNEILLETKLLLGLSLFVSLVIYLIFAELEDLSTTSKR